MHTMVAMVGQRAVLIDKLAVPELSDLGHLRPRALQGCLSSSDCSAPAVMSTTTASILRRVHGSWLVRLMALQEAQKEQDWHVIFKHVLMSGMSVLLHTACEGHERFGMP